MLFGRTSPAALHLGPAALHLAPRHNSPPIRLQTAQRPRFSGPERSYDDWGATHSGSVFPTKGESCHVASPGRETDAFCRLWRIVNIA